VYGFPITIGAWCNSRLKIEALRTITRQDDIRAIVLPDKETYINNLRLPVFDDEGRWDGVVSPPKNGECKFCERPSHKGQRKNIVQYLGIAADEPERIARHTKPGIVLPLVDIGWDEAYCRKWCEENGLLSPIYTTATRGGCWFCHNQGVEQLRLLRKDYPNLWELLLKWDLDSPTSFKSAGQTVHDYDKRFMLEEKNLIPKDRTFRWKMLDEYDSDGNRILNERK